MSIYSQNFNGLNIFETTEMCSSMGSLSNWGLIIAPGQEANGDNLSMSLWSSTKTDMLSVLMRVASIRWFWIHTTYIFMVKYESFPKL